MAGADPCAVGFPTIFHVTHWKAGSQWINKILNRCVGDRVVFAEPHAGQLLQRPLLAGRVYTTCYVTRKQFYSVTLPEPWHRFIVIRDLRDTLLSAYFSLRFSHAASPEIIRVRDELTLSGFEGGLLYLLEQWLPPCAAIQRSWLESGDTLIRYEDLLERKVEILVPLLTRQCPLGVSARRVCKAVLACRFVQLAGGRARGEENLESHERKGVAVTGATTSRTV